MDPKDLHVCGGGGDLEDLISGGNLKDPAFLFLVKAPGALLTAKGYQDLWAYHAGYYSASAEA